MLATLTLPRLLAAAEASAGRTFAVTWRNVAAARHAAYWWVLVSGFFEPVLYLLSIGVGVGGLVGDFTVEGARVSYAAFVAPAMLAASAMNGAVAETTMNFFGKMKYMKLYDGVIATPVTPLEIASGELLWALIRGAGYSAAFLVIMCVAGLTTPWLALAALPATVLVGVAFGALGMVTATFLRHWKDFDYIVVVQMALFLFSGTFTPAGDYPPALQLVVQATPLYHGVALLRGLTTGTAGWGAAIDIGYLLALSAVCLSVAARRTGRMLCP